MAQPRRVVTGHDSNGKSVVLSDGTPPQHHPMHGREVGADFYEMWNTTRLVPELTAVEDREPSERDFTIMPVAGHLLRIIDTWHFSTSTRSSVKSCLRSCRSRSN